MLRTQQLSSSSSSLSPSPKGTWSSLPLANIFTEPGVKDLFEQGFMAIKQQGRLDEKIKDFAQRISDMICERCPGICLDPNDVMTFCGPFMTSSDSDAKNVVSTSSTDDVVVHTVELDRGGGVIQGTPSSTVQVVLLLLASFTS
jgi:hypothetical protein